MSKLGSLTVSVLAVALTLSAGFAGPVVADADRGHGNDCDGYDEDNPGRSDGVDERSKNHGGSDCDDDGGDGRDEGSERTQNDTANGNGSDDLDTVGESDDDQRSENGTGDERESDSDDSETDADDSETDVCHGTDEGSTTLDGTDGSETNGTGPDAGADGSSTSTDGTDVEADTPVSDSDPGAAPAAMGFGEADDSSDDTDRPGAGERRETAGLDPSPLLALGLVVLVGLVAAYLRT